MWNNLGQLKKVSIKKGAVSIPTARAAELVGRGIPRGQGQGRPLASGRRGFNPTRGFFEKNRSVSDK